MAESVLCGADNVYAKLQKCVRNGEIFSLEYLSCGVSNCKFENSTDICLVKENMICKCGDDVIGEMTFCDVS